LEDSEILGRDFIAKGSVEGSVEGFVEGSVEGSVDSRTVDDDSGGGTGVFVCTTVAELVSGAVLGRSGSVVSLASTTVGGIVVAGFAPLHHENQLAS
jgi:hypothetical protein